eukprot:TRINITY_DN4057_c0_g1_i1.p1 TRINITY_DN4057_c0_g1~~TRINITY_DN4057_c0_g1_i1.p1  ORF type:complete len:338 (+),score=65.82 TRINITY_DN4057_c0_g1_i1:32-1015(+)
MEAPTQPRTPGIPRTLSSQVLACHEVKGQWAFLHSNKPDLVSQRVVKLDDPSLDKIRELKLGDKIVRSQPSYILVNSTCDVPTRSVVFFRLVEREAPTGKKHVNITYDEDFHFQQKLLKDLLEGLPNMFLASLVNGLSTGVSVPDIVEKVEETDKAVVLKRKGLSKDILGHSSSERPSPSGLSGFLSQSHGSHNSKKGKMAVIGYLMTTYPQELIENRQILQKIKVESEEKNASPHPSPFVQKPVKDSSRRAASSDASDPHADEMDVEESREEMLARTRKRVSFGEEAGITRVDSLYLKLGKLTASKAEIEKKMESILKELDELRIQ